MAKRRQVSPGSRLQVLTESGYRCAVPTCRSILAIDLHHIVHVAEGGGNAPDNLIALCPTCHALFHRGNIKRESIRIWKGMLVALNRAFDQDAIDTLLFLEEYHDSSYVSGDTSKLLLSPDAIFAHRRLIVAGLVFYWKPDQRQISGYLLELTEKGKAVVEAWKSGDSEMLAKALLPTDVDSK